MPGEQARALAALAAAPDAVICVDEAGRVTSFNRSARSLLGMSEALVGRPVWQLIATEEDAGRLQVDVASALAGHESQPLRVERRVRNAAGVPIPGEVTISAAEHEGHRFATLFVRDLSSARLAERLRDVEHRLARVLAAARSGHEIARGVLELLGTSLGFDFAELWLAGEHDATLRYVAGWGRNASSAFTAAGRRIVIGRGEDLAGLAWEIGETVCLDDASSVDGLVRAEAIAESGIRGCAALPILAGGRFAGAVVLARRSSEPLGPELRRSLHAVSAQLTHFAERRRAEKNLAEETVALAAVARATRDLTDAVDAAEAQQAICAAAREVSGAAFTYLALPDKEHGGLSVRSFALAEGAGSVPDGNRHLAPDTPSLAMRAFTQAQAVFVPDIADDPDADGDRAGQLGVVSGLVQPILRDGAPIGVLGLGWTTRQVTLDRRTRLLIRLLADEAGMALSRVDLVTRLEAAARTDPLTGLANVRAWDEQLLRELASSRRDGRPVAIALLDLDGFKPLNDRLGHQAGDRLLRSAAAAWQAQLRQGDLLARLGGDEFAVLLPGCRPDDALSLAERVRRVTPEVTVSVGIAYWDGREALGELMQRADNALYAAKAAGRDRVSVG